MKKYLLIAIVALGFGFTACSGGQKTESAPANDAPAAVQPAATTDSTTVNTDSTAVKVDTVNTNK